MPLRIGRCLKPIVLLPLILLSSMSAFEVSRLRRWDLPQVIFQVKESVEPGSVMGNIYEKTNLPLERTTHFALPNNPYFKLDLEGSLVVKTQVDRDDNPSLCKDPGYPEVCEWSSFILDNNGNYISLRVIIEDVNDNRPSWSTPSVVINIPENNAPNITTELSAARDPDYGENGIQAYRLVTPRGYEGVFAIKINPFQSVTTTALKRRQTNEQSRPQKPHLPSSIGTPNLILLKSLDREEQPWINLTLLAIDGSAPFHTGSLSVLVKVGDENDHSPSFTFQHYVAQLPENADVGSAVQLQPISNTRQADDSGVDGQLVDHLQAEDRDEGANGCVYYGFARSTPLETQQTFQIDSQTGQIRVVRPLSYDDGPTYWNFQVIATDNGRPPRSSQTDVSIKLVDFNNHPPSINIQPSTPYQTLDENQDKEMTIFRLKEGVTFSNLLLATVTVNDRDTAAGGIFECYLRSETGKHFSLVLHGQISNVIIYNLFVNGIFDREEVPVRNVQVFCEDKGNPRLTSNHLIRILIEDVNDNSPVFEFPFYRQITKEAQPRGSVVGQVKAIDSDVGENSRLSYEIHWPNGTHEKDSVLEIDPQTGNLITKVTLDRETAQYGYNMTVICRDNGTPRRSASARVHLILKDVNDCVPELSQSEYNFTLVEDYSSTFVGRRLVGNVEATDCDTPEFSHISYGLVDSHNLFAIDNRGAIYTTGILDREQSYLHEILVLATDGQIDKSYRESRPRVALGSSSPIPYNTATATVRIIVEDLNDNPPHFVHPTIASNPTHVSYHEDVGFVLTRIVAIDSDNGNNGTVSYRIVQGDRYDIFKLGPKSGDLYVSLKMASNHQGNYTLLIEAKDQGPNPRIAFTDVEIVIDDSPPVGLHNDFLLGMGADKGQGVRSTGTAGGLFGSLEAETLVVIYIVAGICFVSLSLFAAVAVFCRRQRPRQVAGRGQGAGPKTNGFIEVNVNAVENNSDGCYQRGEDIYKLSAREQPLSTELTSFTTVPNRQTNSLEATRNHKPDIQQTVSPLEEPYTIRMGSLSNTHRTITNRAFTQSPISAVSGPTTFAYLVSNIPTHTSSGGEFYLVSQSPTLSNEAVVRQDLKMEPVTTPSSITNLAGSEMITVPISADTLVGTELWANDSISTEAYVTLKPYCPVDGCFRDVRLIDSTAKMHSSITSIPNRNCLILQPPERPLTPHDIHGHSRTDCSSPVPLQHTSPSISIFDPITGSRIFVPPFTTNANPITSSASPKSPESFAFTDTVDKGGIPDSLDKEPAKNCGENKLVTEIDVVPPRPPDINDSVERTL